MEKTVQEQEVWETYKQIEAENYHLKKQLQKKNKEVKQLKHVVRVLKNKEKKRNRDEDRKYKNNKRGNRNHG